MAHPAPRPGCGERAHEDSCQLRGAPGLGRSQAGDPEGAGRGSPWERRLLFPPPPLPVFLVSGPASRGW